MTTYYPIAYIVPQYMDDNGDPYVGAVLKAYRAGTTTNIVFSVDTAGSSTATSIALNADGNPEVSGNVLIPYIAEAFKLALYPSQAAADSNTGAIWTVDNIPILANANAVRYLEYAEDTGSADAYVITPIPAITAYAAGQVVTLIPTNNNTGASTISVSGLPNKDIKDAYGNALGAGFLNTSGMYTLLYNGTYFVAGRNELYSRAGLGSTVNWNTGVLVPGVYATSGTTYTGTLPLGSSTEHTGSLTVEGAGNDLYQIWKNGLVRQEWHRMTTNGGTNWTGWKEVTNTNTVSSVAASATLTNADCGILKELTGTNPWTFTLPSASVAGDSWYIHAKNSGSTASGVLTVAAAGSDTIDGQSSITLAPGQCKLIYRSGSAAFSSITVSGVVRRVHTITYDANADLATALPIDDTTPTSSEGAEFMSLSVTPRGHAATSTTFHLVLTGNLSAAAAIQGITLFAGTQLINCMTVNATAATAIQGFSLQGEYTATGITAITFSARIGNAAGNAVRLNGTGSARHFGGSQKAMLTIFEIGYV